MKQKKKFSGKFSLLTIFILFMSIITNQAYAAKLPFTDVPEKSWYYDDVKSAYESDLISGKKPTKYAPDDNMTAAEAVKLAAAMYMLKNEGKVNFSPSKPWYKVYVDYAKQKNLITDDLDWNKKITRAGYMQIFANILTDEEAKKNEVSDGAIPDVPMTHPNAPAIYKLYRAGIVTGIDEKKNCSPASNIKRSEVAAILIRMMDVKRRLGFSLGGGTTPGTTPPEGTTPPGGSTPPIYTPLPEIKTFQITKQPVSVKGNFGDLVTLEVEAEGGTPPYSYQWEFKTGVPPLAVYMKTGDNKNVLATVIPNIPTYYHCIVTDLKGNSLTSNSATLEMDLSKALRIIKQPENTTGQAGMRARLEVQVTGGKPPYRYQWEERKVGDVKYTNSSEAGSTTNVLSPYIKEKVYDYRCIVTDADGNMKVSNEARVTEDVDTRPLVITKPPADVKGKLKELVRLEVQVSGGKQPYRFQWQYRRYNSDSFYDSTSEGNKTIVLKPPVEAIVYYYKCIVTDANGNTVTSSEAKVEREKDANSLRITKQPKDAYGELYDKVTLEVEVEGGVKPYKYQWYSRKLGSPQEVKSTEIGSTTNKLKPYIYKDIHAYYCEIIDAEGTELQSKTVSVYKSK